MKGENEVREYESETQGIDFDRKYFEFICLQNECKLIINH
jgi:hypothetical protein